MQLRVDRIPDAGLRLVERLDPEALAELSGLEQRSDLRFVEPVEVRVAVQKSNQMIEVDGSLSLVLEATCSRCLEACQVESSGEFALTFTSREDPHMDPTDSDRELSEDDLGLVHFKGETLDLTPFVTEQVLLTLPSHPLCQQECRGLCSRCGQNLNSGDCACPAGPIDTPFAKLKDLKFD